VLKISTLRPLWKQITFEENEPGICWNTSMAEERVFYVKAGDKMCSVGMIRRGRNWNDYGTPEMHCADCPYFLHRRVMGRAEKELLHELEETLKRRIKV
jgi:hypothetical protein